MDAIRDMEKAMEGREMSTEPYPYSEQTALFKLFSYPSEETTEKMLNIENADDNFLRKWEKELDLSDPKPVIEKRFESFKEFRDFVNLDASEEQIGLAFRGEPSASKSWTLEAKLFRLLRKNQSPINARDELRGSFSNILGNRLFKLQEEPSEDHKFAIMQHYGIPTQLLDWTESAEIALFFAFNPVSVSADEEYVVVYIADIGKTHFSVYCADNDIDADEIKRCPTKGFFDAELSKLFSNYWIFLRQTQFWDIRISAQMGLFAWQGTKEPLDKFLSDSNAPSMTLLKCLIPVKDRKEVMKYLKKQGITSETIFPSWEKICEKVDNEFRNYLTTPGSALGHTMP